VGGFIPQRYESGIPKPSPIGSTTPGRLDRIGADCALELENYKLREKL
jgi:hypothetical protein